MVRYAALSRAMPIVSRRLPKQIERNSQELLELPALWKTLAKGFDRVAVVIAERC
jgi:hypothetical protein